MSDCTVKDPEAQGGEVAWGGHPGEGLQRQPSVWWPEPQFSVFPPPPADGLS